MDASIFPILITNKEGRDIDLEVIKTSLGSLYLGSRAANDAWNSLRIGVPRDVKKAQQAVRILNGLGYETDEDDLLR